MKLLLRWILSAAALLLIGRFLPGVELTGVYAALITAIILGLINAVLRPILLLLTLPVSVITLGLFAVVVNSFLFWLAGTIVDGFSVTWFLPAFFGAILMSIASWIINEALRSE